ncbi:MAG TPA: phage portal protein, partial [Gemmobacter sp.]|nr:phage portal protein [Gemmobacter sp.]
MRVGAVYACVLVLSQSIAQLPIHIYRKNGKRKEIATDHPLYPLIHDQPNEWMTDYEMKQLVMVHLCLRGNSVWLKTRGAGGRIAELIPIHPDRVQEIVQDERYR